MNITKEQFEKKRNEFYNHSVIQNIKAKKRWTFSDDKKKPIDMFLFEYEHKISGALFQDERSLVSLDKLLSLIPGLLNYAFYLDALGDNYVVLDIEPKCPKEIKEKLLKMPYLYGETSLSGKGYHLLFPLPKHILEKYPNAQNKIVMKEENGYYEILLNHWCTFTGNQISAPTESSQIDFEAFFEEICQKQKKVVRNEISVDDFCEDLNSIPYYEKIMEILADVFSAYKKTPNDFGGDMSKWEYAIIGNLHFQLKNILQIEAIRKTGFVYTENIKAHILYQITKDRIPYREKHDETRNGLPWLLYLAGEVIAKDLSKKERK